MFMNAANVVFGGVSPTTRTNVKDALYELGALYDDVEQVVREELLAMEQVFPNPYRALAQLVQRIFEQRVQVRVDHAPSVDHALSVLSTMVVVFLNLEFSITCFDGVTLCCTHPLQRVHVCHAIPHTQMTLDRLLVVPGKQVQDDELSLYLSFLVEIYRKTKTLCDKLDTMLGGACNVMVRGNRVGVHDPCVYHVCMHVERCWWGASGRGCQQRVM